MKSWGRFGNEDTDFWFDEIVLMPISVLQRGTLDQDVQGETEDKRHVPFRQKRPTRTAAPKANLIQWA